MPGPWSATQKRSISAWSSTPISTFLRGSLNLMALESRLSRICCSLPASARTVREDFTTCSTLRSFFCAIAPTSEQAMASCWPGSSGCSSSATRPASILARSSTELINESRCLPLARISPTNWTWSGSSFCFSSSISSENPITAFSGVRSSCDMLARNSLLSWLARPISVFFCSSSVCLAASCSDCSRRASLRWASWSANRSVCPCSSWRPIASASGSASSTRNAICCGVGFLVNPAASTPTSRSPMVSGTMERLLGRPAASPASKRSSASSGSESSSNGLRVLNTGADRGAAKIISGEVKAGDLGEGVGYSGEALSVAEIVLRDGFFVRGDPGYRGARF